MESNQITVNASAVAGYALIFTLLLWAGVAFVIWLFARKRYRFGVVWFYTNLTVAFLSLITGSSLSPNSTYFKYSACVLLVGIIRYFSLAVGWIVKRLSSGKFGVFQISRVCWTAAGIALLIVLSIYH